MVGKGKKLFGKLSSTKEDSDSDRGTQHTSITVLSSKVAIIVAHFKGKIW